MAYLVRVTIPEITRERAPAARVRALLIYRGFIRPRPESIAAGGARGGARRAEPAVAALDIDRGAGHLRVAVRQEKAPAVDEELGLIAPEADVPRAAAKTARLPFI